MNATVRVSYSGIVYPVGKNTEKTRIVKIPYEKKTEFQNIVLIEINSLIFCFSSSPSNLSIFGKGISLNEITNLIIEIDHLNYRNKKV